MAPRVTFTRLGKFGRLGNQMFQYAAGFALAQELGVPFGTASRAELHEVFGTTAKRLRRYPKPIRRNLEKRLRVFTEPEAPHLGFDSGLENQRAPVDLRGFFQSERHFERYSKEIAREFTPHARHQSRANERVSSLIGSREEYAVIHVRRTDYIELSLFNTLSTAYAAACAARFPAGIPILVVSDDAAWCRSVFTADRFKFFDREPEHPVHDMLAIARARYVAIANSSFSWWGAWLGEASGASEVVLAPSPAFKGFKPVDYTPERWELMRGPWWDQGPAVIDDEAIEIAREALHQSDNQARSSCPS